MLTKVIHGRDSSFRRDLRIGRLQGGLLLEPAVSCINFPCSRACVDRHSDQQSLVVHGTRNLPLQECAGVGAKLDFFSPISEVEKASFCW